MAPALTELEANPQSAGLSTLSAHPKRWSSKPSRQASSIIELHHKAHDDEFAALA
jgi:hypothetical protein